MGIAIGDSRIHSVVVQRGKPVWAATADYTDETDLAEALAALSAERPFKIRRTRVALGGQCAVVKTIGGFPGLREADLAAHVQLRSRRYFLQNGIPLVTSARHIRCKGKPTGEILLAAADAPLLDAIGKGLAAGGLFCDAIVPADALTPPVGDLAGLAAAVATQRGMLILEPQHARGARIASARITTMHFAVAAAISLAIAGAVWVANASWRLRHDQDELRRLQPALASALRVQSDLDAATMALNELAAATRDRSRLAHSLATLTASLPDSSFLINLSLNRNGGTATGFAAQSGAVVHALARSSSLTSIRFDGPVSRVSVAGRDWERFTIRFERAR